MVGVIAAGGGGFGGLAAYCLEEKLKQQEQEQQEEERQEREREQEAREWMPDQGGSEEARERDETEIRSGGREREPEAHHRGRGAARGDDEEKKKQEARERERKAEAGRRLAGRVEWTETRNLATNDPWRAARIMGATAADGPELKRLAGGKATGRKLAKPVCHYTLNWAPAERPGRAEMSRAVTGSLQTLGLDRHQALIVAHGDRPHAHVHVIVNRVDAENGKAASLSQSRLKLSKWAEGYERTQGKIRCPNRERHNRRRARGERVEPQPRVPQARFRRSHWDPPPHRRVPPERERMNAAEQGQWKRIERSVWEQSARSRARSIADLSTRANGEWRALYDRQRREQKAEGKAASTIRGRFRHWREKGSHLGQLRATLTRDSELWRRWRSEMEARHKRERAGLGKQHTVMARESESYGAQKYNYQVAFEVRAVEIASLDRRDRERQQEAKERVERWRKEHGVQPQRRPEPQRERERSRDRDDGPSR